MASPWQELEIEPTGDVVAIRRAYRARLRRTRPEEAARLQAAYEGAIAASPLATISVPEPPATGDVIGEALAEGHPVKAATLIADGRAQGTLTLRHDIEMTERLLAYMVTARSVSLVDIEQVAARLGWFDAARELPAGAAFVGLRARLAAERWLDGVREAAAKPRLFDARASAARLLVGPAPTVLGRVTTPRAALLALLAEFDRHSEWIGDRLDAANVGDARRAAGSAE